MKYSIATKPTGIRSSHENLNGFISMTTAVSVKMAAEAPMNVESGGKNGTLKGKLRSPPRKNAKDMRFQLDMLSRVLPKT